MHQDDVIEAAQSYARWWARKLGPAFEDDASQTAALSVLRAQAAGNTLSVKTARVIGLRAFREASRAGLPVHTGLGRPAPSGLRPPVPLDDGIPDQSAHEALDTRILRRQLADRMRKCANARNLDLLEQLLDDPDELPGTSIQRFRLRARLRTDKVIQQMWKDCK